MDLTADKALIFRITHIDNVSWILNHGLHSRNSREFDPDFRNIGNVELISRRHSRLVPIPPGGTLSDYIPFYFTPYSIMLYNIHTGHGGIMQVPNDEILIMVSKLQRIEDLGLQYVFTDQHAYPVNARYYRSLADLEKIDWPLLNSRDFKNDPEDPGKKERYQAEALIYRHLPIDGLLAVVCHSAGVQRRLQAEVDNRGLDVRIEVKSSWYF